MASRSEPPRKNPSVGPPPVGSEPTVPANAASSRPPAPLPPPPAPPPRPSQALPVPPPPAPTTGSVERVAAKETFAPDEPLPTFTLPLIEEEAKLELLRRVEEASGRPKTSVERVAAKESFAPDEPLPAFTYPVIEEDQKAELLRRVEAARTAPVDAPGLEGVPPASLRPVPPPPSSETPAAGDPLRSASQPPEPAKGASGASRAARDVAESVRASALRAYSAACSAIDDARADLPPRVRDPLARVPSGVIVSALAVFGLAFFLGGFLLVRGITDKDSPPAAASAAPSVAPPVEDPVPRALEDAKRQGHGALEALSTRFPEDARVWLALAASHSSRANHAEAVSAVAKAVKLDPKASADARAGEALSLSVRKRDSSDAAFALLAESMGGPGAGILYDLSIDAHVPPALRARAEQWVRSEAFTKVAGSDVALAAALRYAKSCSERHALLPRAAEKGEERVLDYLKIARGQTGCGRRAKKDCFPCLRKDDELKNALAAVEQRVKARH